jgi:hypothetical protein
VGDLNLSQECLASYTTRAALQNLAKTNPELHLELSQPREGPTKDPKRKRSHKKKMRKESSQHSKTRGRGSQKWSRKDADSELDTDSGSESDPEDDVPLDFDALDSNGDGEEDVTEDSSASSDEDDVKPPFGEQHDFGDDEDVSADAIIQVMMHENTAGLGISKREDGSLFHPISGAAQGDGGDSDEEPQVLGRGKRKRKCVDKAHDLRHWDRK